MLPVDRASCVAAANRGKSLRFLFFWGHKRSADGAVGPSCLSQWWRAPFTVDGDVYPTAEHWMMAGKARLFRDRAAERRVLEAPHPKAAKAIGRRVRDFDEATWRTHRDGIVEAGNLHKFGQHPELAAYLRGTGRRVLVEASPVDRIWGIGLAASDPRAKDPRKWRGDNRLGFVLMRVREALAQADH